MAEEKDVILPGTDNPLLDPTLRGNGMFRVMPDIHTGEPLPSKEEMQQKGPYRPTGEKLEVQNLRQLKGSNDYRKSYWGDHPMANLQSYDVGPKPVTKTERIPPQRDLSGGGAKSGIKPYKKSVSAFGRTDSPLARAAVGGMKNMIPTMGLSVAGISLGPFRFAPITYQGAFPVLNLRQWDKAMTASYINLEDEQGNA
jgi:hypothetical protein